MLSGSGERAHEVKPDCSEERRERGRRGRGVGGGETKQTTIAKLCTRAPVAHDTTDRVLRTSARRARPRHTINS